MEINRTMDMYEITTAPHKVVRISLVPDNPYVIGTSGKRLKRASASFPAGSIVNYLMNIALSNRNADMREYADRLISLPDYDYSEKDFMFKVLCTEQRRRREPVSWKDLMTFWKDAHGEEYKLDALKAVVREYGWHDNILFDDVKSAYEKAIFNLADYYPAEAVAVLMEIRIKEYWRFSQFSEYTKTYKAFREGVKYIIKKKKQSEEMTQTLKNKLTEMCDGLRYEEACEVVKVYITERYDTKNEIHELISALEDALNYARELELTDYKFTNIKRDLEELRTKYEAERTARENARFAKNQSDPCLPFEDEQYRIYIPTTRDDLAKIGKTFSNCANGWEWNSRLCNGAYWLVVVVNKETNKMKACVDIHCITKRIGQYLGERNTSFEKGSPLLDFSKKYQRHLETFKGE